MSVGTIAGQVRIDVRQAIASYIALRAQNASTISALRGSSATFKAVGVAATVLGVAALAGFGKAVSAAAEFEKRLDFFGAVSNSTTVQMEAIRKKAIQLGQDTIYSANQIADSFVELGKAGISADDIIAGVGEAVAHLGAAADIPLVDAANIITAAVETFNLKARDAVHVADLLAGAANASIVEVQDLGVSLKYVGGVAAATHIPIESVITAISLLGKAGIKGSTGGTALRQILLSLQGNSKKATEQLEKLGIITKDGGNLFVDAAGHIKPLDQVFQILQDHTAGLTEAQRLMALKVIFNNRAIAAAAILTKEGAKGFASMNKEIGKTTAAEVAAKRLDNLSGDIEILRGNIETLFIQGGSPFQNFFRTIVQGLTKILGAFIALPSGVQTGIFAFLGIAGVLLTFVGAIALIGSQVLKFIEIIRLLGPAFTILRVGILGVVNGMRLLTIAFLTNPIGLIIVAVIALVAGFYLLYTRSTAFRNFINSLGPLFIRVWQAVVDFFKQVPAFFSKMWSDIENFFQTGVDFIKNHWGLILAIITGPLGLIVYAVVTFKDQIVGFFVNLWTSVSTATSNGITSLDNFLATLPERMAYWIGFAIGRSIKLFIDFWVQLYDETVSGVEATVGYLGRLPGYINSLFLQARTYATNQWNAFWSTVTSLTQRTYNGIVGFIGRLPGYINSLFQQSRTYATNQWSAFQSSVINLASRAYSGITGWINRLPGYMNSLFNQARSAAQNQLSSLISSAGTLARQVYNAISNGIAGIPGLISGVFDRALSALSSLISSAYSRARSIGSSLWEGFKAGMGIASPSFIEKAMFALTKNVTAETDKTAAQVGKLQRMANAIPSFDKTKLIDPVASTSSRTGAASIGGKTVNYHTVINNPKPEEPSESITRTHQKLAYLGADE